MNIVVLGGGIAGVKAARLLHATLITDNKEFTFLPLLPDCINGEENAASRPITSMHEKVIIGHAERIDFKNKKVILQDEEVSYDYLVIATGAKAATPVPGAQTYTKTFYTKKDALDIKARLPAKNIVIIGGGPTGVELAFELQKHGQVTLLHAVDKLVQFFSSNCQKAAHKELEKAGVHVVYNEFVQSIGARHVQAKKKYPYDLCVWTAGVEANLVAGPKAEKGILVNEFLQVHGQENVFAIGDCAQTGSPLTAQAALLEARIAAKNIKRKQKGKALKKYVYKEKGTMLQLGSKAHIQAGPIQFSGKLAALLRRLYYQYTIATL